jgi:hypothetical protein
VVLGSQGICLGQGEILTLSLVDAAQIASPVAACGALMAAVVQVRGLRRDALEGRVGEILGVPSTRTLARGQ